MRLLALDQGTSVSGYAFFDGTDLVRHGVISANKKDEYWIRLQYMRNKVERMIKEYRPDYVVIEGIAMQRDQQALIKLGQLQGVIMGAAFSNQIPVDILLPTHWRKLNGFKQGAGVKREDLKRQAFDMVQDCYRLMPVPTEDEAEAIAIGIAWLREREYLPALGEVKTKKKEKKDNGRKNKKDEEDSRTGGTGGARRDRKAEAV